MLNILRKKISYYLWASYRRKILDKLQEKNINQYKGVVLDIGGRDRGCFKKPKDKVEKWIFADINEEHSPDIVLNVSNMTNIESETIDTISAIELFEHVEFPEKGIRECVRLLKSGGKIILSMPFLYPLHADPFDFQRWTKDKWLNVLKSNNLKVEVFEITGYFFTVLGDAIKAYLRKLPRFFRVACYFFYPLLDGFVLLDRLVNKNGVLGKYHGGYFIIAKK